jgi:hypothetical protein
MDEDGTIVEDVQAVKVDDLIGALGVSTFCGVDDEGRIEACGVVSRNKIGLECERMSPPEVCDNADGKFGCSESHMDWVVMADGGDTREEITDGAPPKPSVERDLKVSGDGLGMELVDFGSPLPCVTEGWLA